jgi:hypothetical protein
MTTEMDYFLGVKTVEDAANALDELTFVKILDRSTLHMRLNNIDRMKIMVAPASEDNDLAKGVMIWIGGGFTTSEMSEIENLGRLADMSVTALATTFVAKHVIARQRAGMATTQMILGPGPK